MAYSIFGSRAVLALAFLACACGGSASDDSAAGGATSAGTLGGGGGPATAGASGSLGSGAGAIGVAGAHSSSGSGNGAGAANGSSSCPAITPCGGDLVGDWTIKQECMTTLMDAVSVCAGATRSMSPLRVTGSVSFRADKTMTSTGVIAFSESIQIPSSCFTVDECMQYGSLFTGQTGVIDSTCAYDANTGCFCSLDVSADTMSSGTYEVQGTNVTITNSSTAKTEVDSFCVSGSTLKVSQTNANGASATLILTKSGS